MTKRTYTSRRCYTLEPTSSKPYLELSEALRYLRKHHVFLCWTDNGPDLWTCGRKMPQPLRRSVFKHRKQLARMMHEHDWRVCPTYRHAFEWVYFPGEDRHMCLLCARIGA